MTSNIRHGIETRLSSAGTKRPLTGQEKQYSPLFKARRSFEVDRNENDEENDETTTVSDEESLQDSTDEASAGAVRDGYPQVTERIRTYFNTHAQTPDAFERKKQLREEFENFLRGIFPNEDLQLHMFGSSMTGFGQDSSDVDLCLMIKTSLQDMYILRKISTSLSGPFKSKRLVSAKVPLLQFVDQDRNIECDLSVNNPLGTRNSHLLWYYGKCDSRFGPLALYIKHWASHHNINSAFDHTISSYSFMLMLIHYLQVDCEPSILPCLQVLFPSFFGNITPLQDLNYSKELTLPPSKNNCSLGELFLGFLKYYASTFSFDDHAISVRKGAKVLKSSVKFQSPRVPRGQWKYLCIEEPFDLSNTAKGVFNYLAFRRILATFVKSYQTLLAQELTMLPNP